MPISQQQLAERWELSKGRISQLVAEGLPLTSFEDAERWRAERYHLTGVPHSGVQPPAADDSVKETGATTLETFDAIVERQRILVQVARNQYVKAVRENSPQQSKLYASYDRTVMTLTKLKAEADRLAVVSREYIRAIDAEAVVKEMTGEFLNRLDKLPLECAELCNPDSPAKAVKVLEAWVRKVRADLSNG